MEDVNKDISVNLIEFRELMKREREAKEITKTALAKAIDKSISLICDIEAGRKNPSVETMTDIAKVLGISLDSIFFNH